MRVADVTAPHRFQALVRELMRAEHGPAYQVVDGAAGDGGLDGFVRTSGQFQATYCPRKPETARYARRFKAEIEKARRFRDETGHPVRSFAFITPTPMREPLRRQLRDAALALGFDDGVNLSGEDLDALLGRHPAISNDFPAVSPAGDQTVTVNGGRNLTVVAGRDVILDVRELAEVIRQGSWLQDLLPKPPASVHPDIGAGLSGDEVESLRHYAAWIIERYDDLELPGLPQREHRRNVPLENVFVALRGGLGGTYEMRQGQALLEERAGWIADFAEGERLTPAERYRRRCRVAAALARDPHPETLLERDRTHLYHVGIERTLPLSDAFRRERRLVILGDPGSGKSTLVRWLAVQFARAYLAGKPQVEVLLHHADPDAETGDAMVSLGPTRIPILLRIAQFAHDRQTAPGRRLGSFIGHHLGERYGEAVVDSRGHTLDPHRLNAVLRQLVDAGQTILLLDGLDEINDPDARHAVTAEIDEYLNGTLDPLEGEVEGGDGTGLPWRAGGNQAVVTSRIVGYKIAPLRGEAAQLTIEPMGERAIERFCELWMRAVHQVSIPRNRWNEDAERQARVEADALKRSIAELRQRGSGDLATNPLLLTILALVFRDGLSRTGSPSFPRERVRLYDTAVHILIRTWQERARAKGDRVFADAEVLAVLTPVAEHIHRTSGIGVIDEETLQTLLRSELSSGDVDTFHHVVRTEVGLLAARGEGVYGFLHLTFQEFLAARALVERPGDLAARLTAYLSEPRWREPSLMALGLARERMSAPNFHHLLTTLLDDGDPLSRALPRVEGLLAAALADVSAFPEPVLERVLGQLLERYGSGAVQGRLTGLKEEIERITRSCVAGLHARVAEQVFLAALRTGDVERVCTAAALLRAVRFYTPALAAGLTEALELDDEARGWPVDRALRSLVAQQPALLPGPVHGLKAQLTRNAALAERFTRDPGWARIGIALYGGVDGSLDERVAALQAEIARHQEKIQELNDLGAPASEREARQPEIARLEAETSALREQIKRVRADACEFDPARMHRESTLTPFVLSALRAGSSALEFAEGLRGLPGAGQPPALIRDALLAMRVLGASIDQLAELPQPLLAELRTGSRRISSYLEPVVEASARAVIEAVRGAGLWRWDHEYLRYTFRSVFRLVRGPLLEPPDLVTLQAQAPEPMADDLLAESLVKDVVTPTDDPVYNWAVTLDTRGHSLGADPARLARALARVPRCAAARWQGARRWVRYDPLASVPEEPVDVAAAALDTLAAMPEVFDFVRGWMLTRLTPFLAESDLVPEAVLLCLHSVSDRFGGRGECLAALLGAEAATQATWQKQGVEQAHLKRVMTVTDPFRRVRAAFQLLAHVPRLLDASALAEADLARRIRQIDRPDRQAWAWLRLLEHTRPERRRRYLKAAVRAARAVGDPSHRARLLARLALDATLPAPDTLVQDVFTAVSETQDRARRIELLADLRDAVDGADVAPALGEAFRRGCDDQLARIDDPFWRAAASGLVAPPLSLLGSELGGQLRGIGTLLLSALLTDAESVLGRPRSGAAPTATPREDVDAFPELENRLRQLAREGPGPLAAGAARLVGRLVAAGRVADAATLLTLVSDADSAALPYVRSWLAHADPTLRRHAALILAEADDLNPQTVPAVCDWLESDEDLPRLRALRVLNFDDTRERRLRASRVGDEVLVYVRARIEEVGDHDIRQASILGWFFERVILDDPTLLGRWLEAVDRGGASIEEERDPTYRLVFSFKRVERPVVDMIVARLPSASPQAQRALFHLVCLASHDGGPADDQLRALLPVLRDAANALRTITYLPQPFLSLVDVLESLDPSPDASSAEVALRADEQLSRRIRFVDGAWEEPAQLRRLLIEIGRQRFVGVEWRNEVREAARRVIQKPELFERLLRWIDGLEELQAPVTYEERYVYADNALLEVAAAASERLPDALFKLAGTLPFLRRRLQRSARDANSFPARQAAFALLSFVGTIDTGVVEAIQAGLRDNVLVQKTLLQTLDRYRAIDEDAVKALLRGVDQPSASFAFTSLRLLRAVAQNPRFDEASRRMIVEFVAQALDRPLAARDVYLCATTRDDPANDGWRIRYAGRLGDACYELLSELSGFSTASSNPLW